MESVCSLDLLLLPSSLGFVDLLRIHKILEDDIGPSTPESAPELLRSESESSSLISQDLPVSIVDYPNHVTESSFISEGYPSPRPESSNSFCHEESETGSDRAPCSLPLISKSIRRKLDFHDEGFSHWFVEVELVLRDTFTNLSSSIRNLKDPS
jgi:hypothetical protein